jgi:hypothetical protein
MVDLYKAIQDLHAEKQRLDLTIAALEAIERPAGMAAQPGVKRRGRKDMNEQERQQVSQRMKRYWALRRQEQQLT